jgi:prepilin-type N-terminal cleavage/methylation domain-containing protein/prepilin-type processing-associated H-X9-DG protein
MVINGRLYDEYGTSHLPIHLTLERIEFEIFMRKTAFKKKKSRSLYKPFTFIELLVVVAILGILVSLLLPSLRNARKESKIAVCASNLKQLGVAMYSFAVHNNNKLPENNGYVSWDDLLSDYDGRKPLTSAQKNSGALLKSIYGDYYGAVYKCPLYEGPNTTNLDITYAVTNYSGGHHAGLGLINTGYSAKLINVSQPSSTIMMFDFNRAGYTRMGRADYSVERATDLLKWEFFAKGKMMHGGLNVNYLMVDGSAKGMDFLQTIVPYGANSWYVGGSLWDATK